MIIEFEKYQGNGNDFIIIDDRKNIFNNSVNNIKYLCNRHFGIGADGLILVRSSESADFEMLYFNSDGELSTMCGNGGRCIAAFSFNHKIADKNMSFDAIDGLHNAIINSIIIKNKIYDVSLKMTDVSKAKQGNDFYFIDTGSPHHIIFTDNVKELDVFKNGKKIRYSEMYKPSGVNVDFVQIYKNTIFVRTYERGVEDETLSCGTGVTASAIATYIKTGIIPEKIETLGGFFKVDFEEYNGIFKNVWLKGPAEMVFKGKIEI